MRLRRNAIVAAAALVLCPAVVSAQETAPAAMPTKVLSPADLTRLINTPA